MYRHLQSKTKMQVNGVVCNIDNSSTLSASFDSFSHDYHANQQKETIESSTYGNQMKLTNYDEEKLKLPKMEQLNGEYATGQLIECFPQFEEAADLKTDNNFISSPKCFSFYSCTDSCTLEAIVRNVPLSMPLSFHTCEKLDHQSSSPIPQKILAHQRRRIISDRTRFLQKLMPWKKKMDMATMLEEAYKYITYLKAQVSVLQSMSCQSSLTSSRLPAFSAGGAFPMLYKLSRRQLLQVLVNSPVAQTILYSQDCCVYSLEQVIS